MGHVALRVLDLDQASSHARVTLGLRESTRTPTEVYLSSNEKHHELQLILDSRAGFDHVGFEFETDEDLESVRRRVAASDAGRVLDERTDEHGLGEAFRFVGPAGITYEAYVAMTRGTLAPERFLGPLVRKFGHLTFHCEQHDELVSFWTTILGFRLSDYAEGTTWVRCDSDHHGLAVASVPGAYRLHHHAWEIQDVGTLTKYCDNIALKGHSLLWGPVRHGPGFNIATYLADPDGAVTEVYADLLRIDDDSNYTAVDWSAETRALNLWGPRPSDELLTAGTPILGRPAAVAEGVA